MYPRHFFPSSLILLIDFIIQFSIIIKVDALITFLLIYSNKFWNAIISLLKNCFQIWYYKIPCFISCCLFQINLLHFQGKVFLHGIILCNLLYHFADANLPVTNLVTEAILYSNLTLIEALESLTWSSVDFVTYIHWIDTLQNCVCKGRGARVKNT